MSCFLNGLLLISLQTCVTGIAHSAWCYFSDPQTSLVIFQGPRSPPPNALLAHVYGVKNFYTCMIRAYALYNLNSQPLYDLAMATYAGVLWLYITELGVWKTVRPREAYIALATAGLGFSWMFMQRDWYLSR